MRPLVIHGIGTAVPPYSISQQQAATAASTFEWQGRSADALARLYRRSGVASRHSVVLESSTNGDAARQTFYSPAESPQDRGPRLAERMEHYESHATPLSLAAARRAILQSGIAADKLTHLVTVSCTGFAAPGFDLQLCQELALPLHVARTHVGFMGCHGLLNALRVAHAFVSADRHANVLIAAVELCSLHQQYGGGADRIVSNSLFADGAAALVCTGPESDGVRAKDAMCYAASYSHIVPGTADLMTWKMRDYGFEMTLSPQVPEVIHAQLAGWLEPWLATHELGLSEIRNWAVHPGGPRILDAVESSLELPTDALRASREILSRYGNMSSPTVAFVLERLGATSDAGPTVLLAFGPGLTVEAAFIC